MPTDSGRGDLVVAPLQFIFKVTARCNLNCSYCYVFNKEDQSWRDRSRVMSDAVFEVALDRIRRHCLASQQPIIRLMFHGGEPMLAGVPRFRRWLERIRGALGGVAHISLAMQTNGVLIDDSWAELLREHAVEVGVSIDGPQEVNDRYRVDHLGRGSYDAILAGMATLRRHDVPFSILSVLQFGADGLEVYRHFQPMGAGTINFLFPDHNHSDILGVRSAYGPHPVADFLLPVADEWYATDGSLGDVPLLRNMARIILGGESRSDMFGNPPLGFVFVETDGEIEGLDVLRLDGEGMSATGLNVLHDDFAAITSVSPFHAKAIFDGLPLPAGCVGCREATTCAGGYLPHRFSLQNGFDNRSVWCQDILILFAHLRTLFGVDVEETSLRRQVLHEMAVVAQ